jgi:hypothetical protein
MKNTGSLQYSITNDVGKSGFDELLIDSLKVGSVKKPTDLKINEIELNFRVSPRFINHE